MFTAGCAVAATAKTVTVLITMRILQGLGGSAVLTIGAGTLAVRRMISCHPARDDKDHRIFSTLRNEARNLDCTTVYVNGTGAELLRAQSFL